MAGGAGGGKLFAEPQKKKGCLGVLVVTVTVSWLIAAVAGAIFG
ncbi:MAG: hypothetical protein N3A38_12130 [Planctomycetota bacterium]|nr:hypothetical protein [Planctomycetota bacterium]